MSSSSSRSSHGPSQVVENVSTIPVTDGHVAPPSIASTARLHDAERVAAAGDRVDGLSTAQSSSSSLDELITDHTAHRPPRLSSSSERPQRYPSSTQRGRGRGRSRRSSSAEVIHQRRRSTLIIAEAEAVRAARDFSMEMYRELHRRKFASLHEELDFLRKDFVASRRTLSLLHEDNTRLERELLARVREIEELQEKLEAIYRVGEDEASGPSSSSPPSAPLRSGRRSSPLASSRHSGAGQRHRGASDASISWADATVCEGGKADAASHDIAHNADVSAGAMESEVDTKFASATEPGNANSSSSTALAVPPPASTSIPAAAVHAKRTPLALYAKTTGKSTNVLAGERSIDVQELIRDLRINLARRDTSLNEAQMELSAVHKDRQTLRTELQSAQTDLLHAKQQRDEVQREVTALEEKNAAHARSLEECRNQLQQLTNEKEEVQRRLTTAELLYQHTGAKGEGDLDALSCGFGSTPGNDTVPSPSSSSTGQHLRDQLQLYRTKWQASEDEVEHLNQRLTQLQLQLVRQGVGASTPHPATSSSENGKNNNSNTNNKLLEVTAQQNAEHALELEILRRQHQEQLQLHAEEIQRLQRRLDRAQENATFHEDQLRQQRQDDSRLHHSEVQALQTQLRTAQGELVKAQQDREHLARQLRRSTEQETTVEVLRGQVDQLKQRLGEVGAELAQVRGREKETNLLIQRERMSRAKTEHDAEDAREALARERKERQYLQDEVTLLREQLGMQEASASTLGCGAGSLPQRSTAQENRSQRQLSMRDVTDALGDDGGGSGDAAALASELKGYVSLMRVNTTLHRRIEELEAQVAQLTSSAAAAEKNICSLRSDPPRREPLPQPVLDASPAPHAQVSSTVEAKQMTELERLRGELDAALQAQRELLSNCVETEKDRRLLVQDNATLASGVEVLQRRLSKVQAAMAADKARRRHVSKQRSKERERRKKSAQRHTDIHAASLHNPPPPSEESRLRQRLQSARAQDQNALQSGMEKEALHHVSSAPTLNDSPLLYQGSLSSQRCCCCRCCPSVAAPPQHPGCHHHDAPTTVPLKSLLPAQCCGTADCAPRAVGCDFSTPPPATPSSITAPPPPSPPPVAAAAPSAPLDDAIAEKEVPVNPPPLPLTNIQVVLAAAITRRDASSSPLHSPRHRVHGSVLPPVHYPSLVLKSRA